MKVKNVAYALGSRSHLATKWSKHLAVCQTVLSFSSIACLVLKLYPDSIHESKPHPVQWS